MIPTAPTLAGWRRARRRGAGGEASSWFPFTTGAWMFSGRVAIYHGVARLGLPARSTVLVPAYHEGIEIDALLAAGHRVRYYRVDPALRVDLGSVAARLSDDVAALYVIHYFGLPQPLGELRTFCDARGIRLIEDCALALFSRSGQVSLGSVGDLAIFSIYKTLPVPHGGYLVTRRPEASTRPPEDLRPPPLTSTVVQTLDLVHHTLQARGWDGVERALSGASRIGRRLLGWNRDATVSSGGSRWDPRLVAFGVSRWTRRLVGLADPEVVVERRRANYARLAARLAGRVAVPFPDLPPGACPLLLPILVDERERVQLALAQSGVESGRFWPDAHHTCPPELATALAPWRTRCLELPIHQELGTGDMDRVADAVLAATAMTASATRSISASVSS